MLSEGFSVVAEINDFCGTDEGEIKGVEEKQKPFVFVVIER